METVMKKESKFITLKGLVLSVLLSLLMLVITLLVSAALMAVPAVVGILGSGLPAFLCGIPYVLMTAKNRGIGTYFIFSLVFGIYFLASGSFPTAIFFIIAGVIGELTMIGGWQKKWRPLVPYLVHWLMYTYASTLQFLFFKDMILQTYMGMGMDEAAALVAMDSHAAMLTDPFTMIVGTVCCVGLAVLGYFVGTRALRKYFKAAGVA